MTASVGTGVSGSASHAVETAASTLELGVDETAGNKPIRTDTASPNPPINGAPIRQERPTLRRSEGERWDFRTSTRCLGRSQYPVPMKAIVYDRYGPPDVLELREIEEPEVGETEVLVRVRAAAANPLDWFAFTGTPSSPDPDSG